MFMNTQMSPINHSQESCEKKRRLMERIEQDSNEKLQIMTEIIFSNNDSLKRNYEKFMRYHHNYFMNVGYKEK